MDGATPTPGRPMVLTRTDETYCLRGADLAYEGSPGRSAAASHVTSHAAGETGSRNDALWEGTVEEAPSALLHGSRRN